MNHCRRRSIKLITAGTAVTLSRLPVHWTQPVVESVLLPAHAQMSPTPSAGDSLLHFSAVLSNPDGGDCGPDAREMVTVANSGAGPADLSGLAIVRIFADLTTDTIATLSGVLAAGASITVDVCDGSTAGGSAVLNNQLGGVLSLINGADVLDLISYPPSPAEGTIFNYGPNPTSTPPPRGS